MSTEIPETETETEEASTDNQRFEPNAIRSRLPGGVDGKRQRIAICLIRNPDASLTRVAATNNVSTTTVFNTVKGLLHDGTHGGHSHSGTAQAHERREGQRAAETYEELTDKQRSVVDWFARHPGALESFKKKGKDTLTGERVATTISEDSRYDVTLTTTYPYKIVRGEYAALIPERRRWLAAHGELEDEDEEVQTSSLRGQGTRDLLANAGWDLPESNLDSLPTASEDEDVAPEDMSEQKRLDEAYRRGQQKATPEPVTEEDREQYTAPYGCPSCGHQEREDICSKCGHDKRYESDEDETEETPDHSADLTAGADEESEDEADEDLSEELDQPLVDNAEALNEALKGLMTRLNHHQQAIDNLRETAVTEDEVEAILNNFEERMRDALDNHRRSTMDHVEEEVIDEVMDEVDRRLHNSVKADLKRRVEQMEEYLREHPTDGGVEADGRLGLVLAELSDLADEGAEVSTMEVNERRHSREYVIKVKTDEASESMTTEDAEVSQ